MDAPPQRKRARAPEAADTGSDEVACAAHAASTWGAPPGTPPSRTDENAAAYAATALRVAAAEEDPRVVGVDVRSAFLAHPGGWRALDGLVTGAGDGEGAGASRLLAGHAAVEGRGGVGRRASA